MSDAVCPPETVYNLLPKEDRPIAKPPRYVSKFRPTVVLENKLAKDSMRMMGPAKVEVPSPDKYLKKHSKELILSEKSQCSTDVRTTRSCTVRRPPVPLRTDNPPMGIHTKKDFVKTAIQVPVKLQPILVDVCKRHKQHLENSGLAPKYIMKKDYGEVPKYLQERSEEERRAQEEYDNLVKEQKEQGPMRRLSEHQAILEGLRKNWDELHHEYQGLPLVIDTLSKKTRKDRLEKEMKRLEKDIGLFERFKTLYVLND